MFATYKISMDFYTDDNSVDPDLLEEAVAEQTSFSLTLSETPKTESLARRSNKRILLCCRM